MAKRNIDGVEVNDKSIITALKIIKQVCEDNVKDNCASCPMFIDSGCYSSCGVTDSQPRNWKVLEYEKFQALG